jgi:hypothetical protein
MPTTPASPFPFESPWSDSLGVPLFEFADTDPGVTVDHNPIPTPAELLQLMRERIKNFGSPLPEGYVPPPGIDIDALLKQIPWPPVA